MTESKEYGSIADIEAALLDSEFIAVKDGVRFRCGWDEDGSVIGAWPEDCEEAACATERFGDDEHDAAPEIWLWLRGGIEKVADRLAAAEQENAQLTAWMCIMCP